MAFSIDNILHAMIPPVAKVPSYIPPLCAENSVSGNVDAHPLFPAPRTATDFFRTALAPHLEMDGSLKSSSPLTGWRAPPLTPFNHDLTFTLFGKTLTMKEIARAYPGKVCIVGSALPLDAAWAYAAQTSLPLHFFPAFLEGKKRARDLDFVFLPNKKRSLAETLCSLLEVDLPTLKTALREHVCCAEFNLISLHHPGIPVDLVEAESIPHLTTSEGLYVTFDDPTTLRCASGSLAEAVLHRTARIAYYRSFAKEPWKYINGGFKRFIQLQTEGWIALQKGVVSKLLCDSLGTLSSERFSAALIKRIDHLPDAAGIDLAFLCNALFRLREGNKEISEGMLAHLTPPKFEGLEPLYALCREEKCGPAFEQTLLLYAFFKAHLDPLQSALPFVSQTLVENQLRIEISLDFCCSKIVLPPLESCKIPHRFAALLGLMIPLLSCPLPAQANPKAQELMQIALFDEGNSLSKALVAILCFKILRIPQAGLIPALGNLLPHLPSPLKLELMRDFQEAFRAESIAELIADVDFFLELFYSPETDKPALARAVLKRPPLSGNREALKKALKELDLGALLDPEMPDHALILLCELDPALTEKIEAKSPSLQRMSVECALKRKEPQRALELMEQFQIRSERASKTARGILYQLESPTELQSAFRRLQALGFFSGQTALQFSRLMSDEGCVTIELKTMLSENFLLSKAHVRGVLQIREAKGANLVLIKRIAKAHGNRPIDEHHDTLFQALLERGAPLDKMKTAALYYRQGYFEEATALYLTSPLPETFGKKLFPHADTPTAKKLLEKMGFPQEESLLYLQGERDWEVALQLEDPPKELGAKMCGVPLRGCSHPRFARFLELAGEPLVKQTLEEAPELLTASALQRLPPLSAELILELSNRKLFKDELPLLVRKTLLAGGKEEVEALLPLLSSSQTDSELAHHLFHLARLWLADHPNLAFAVFAHLTTPAIDSELKNVLSETAQVLLIANRQEIKPWVDKLFSSKIWQTSDFPEKGIDKLIKLRLLAPAMDCLEARSDPFATLDTTLLVRWNRLLASATSEPKTQEKIVSRAAVLFQNNVGFNQSGGPRNTIRAIWLHPDLQQPIEVSLWSYKLQLYQHIMTALWIRAEEQRKKQRAHLMLSATVLWLKLGCPKFLTPVEQLTEKLADHFSTLVSKVDSALDDQPDWGALRKKMTRVPEEHFRLEREQLEWMVPLFMFALTIIGYFLFAPPEKRP